MGTAKLLGKPNKLRGNDVRWTSILSRGSRNTHSCFMLQKLGISSGSYDPVGSKASFFLYMLSQHFSFSKYFFSVSVTCFLFHEQRKNQTFQYFLLRLQSNCDLAHVCVSSKSFADMIHI